LTVDLLKDAQKIQEAGQEYVYTSTATQALLFLVEDKPHLRGKLKRGQGIYIVPDRDFVAVFFFYDTLCWLNPIFGMTIGNR